MYIRHAHLLHFWFCSPFYLWVYPPQHLSTGRATHSATKPLQCWIAEKKNREAWPSTVLTLLPHQFSNFAILLGFVAPLTSSGRFLRPASHIPVGRKINCTEVSYSSKWLVQCDFILQSINNEKLTEDSLSHFQGLGQNTEDTGLAKLLAEEMTVRKTKGTMQTFLLHPIVSLPTKAVSSQREQAV